MSKINVTVSGEAGIGKTALAELLAEKAADAGLKVVYHTDETRLPVEEILTSLKDQSDRDTEVHIFVTQLPLQVLDEEN